MGADIQILEVQELALPAECARCGTGRSHYKYIDFGLQIIQYGRVVICTNCISEIASVAGYVEADAYARLDSEYSDYMLTVADLKASHEATVAKLRKEIESRDVILESRYGPTASVPDPVLSGDDDLRDSDVPEATTRQRSKAPKTNRGSSKQDPSGGPQIIPSLEDLLGK